MEKFLIFAGMALATYFTRYTMIAALGREVPSLLRRWLRCWRRWSPRLLWPPRDGWRSASTPGPCWQGRLSLGAPATSCGPS